MLVVFVLQIWDLRADGEWVCTARWRCHLGPAWRVAWAHPEFGQVIATCSFDRTIAIWEEVAGGQVSEEGPSMRTLLVFQLFSMYTYNFGEIVSVFVAIKLAVARSCFGCYHK